MSNFLAEPITILPIKPNRSIGDITGYLTVSESSTDKLTITKHPVQQGAQITDHAYKEPSELSISILAGVNVKPLSELYADFLKLQSDREPFTVITGKRSYAKMLLTSVMNTTDKNTENVLSLQLQFQEIITVEVTPTKVPPRSSQRGAGTTGATEKAGKKSALKVFKEGIGSLLGG